MNAGMKGGLVREWLFWTSALISLPLLASMNDAPSFCPYRWMGSGACPGCGLGASMALILKGEFLASLEAHWLGLPAALAILLRWSSLAQKICFTHTNKTHHHAQ